jgi:hypothetical protein
MVVADTTGLPESGPLFEPAAREALPTRSARPMLEDPAISLSVAVRKGAILAGERGPPVWLLKANPGCRTATSVAPGQHGELCAQRKCLYGGRSESLLSSKMLISMLRQALRMSASPSC